MYHIYPVIFVFSAGYMQQSMIPVSVVDDHNEALNHYYKLIAR